MKGKLALEEALGIAKQIAEALEAAHEKGIVHRDLKPGNVKIRPDGTVKVLDFGLAKMAEPADTGARAEDSPTFTLEPATGVGVILGTAAYMPPEQARGKRVDKRADIWAFGVVLYEMLSGERLFAGETISDTLIKVATKEPQWERVPVKAQRLLRRCLDKEPKRRLRDIGDAWELLEERREVVRGGRGFVGWAVAGFLLLGFAIAGWGWWRSSRPVEQPMVRVDVDLGEDVSLRRMDVGYNAASSVIISPDGTRLVYVASVSGGPQKLFTRRLDQFKATELPGTEGAIFAFFSPDGQWVGFATSNKLNKIGVEGGAVFPLADLRTYGARLGSGRQHCCGSTRPLGANTIKRGSGGSVYGALEWRGVACVSASPAGRQGRTFGNVPWLGRRYRQCEYRCGFSARPPPGNPNLRRHLSALCGGRERGWAYRLQQSGNAVRDFIRHKPPGDARDGRCCSGRGGV